MGGNFRPDSVGVFRYIRRHVLERVSLIIGMRQHCLKTLPLLYHQDKKASESMVIQPTQVRVC